MGICIINIINYVGTNSTIMRENQKNNNNAP